MMRYHCKDCSYQGAQVNSGGGCPACGSFNTQVVMQPHTAPPRSRKGQLTLLAVLWLCFAGLLLAKLVD